MSQLPKQMQDMLDVIKDPSKKKLMEDYFFFYLQVHTTIMISHPNGEMSVPVLALRLLELYYKYQE